MKTLLLLLWVISIIGFAARDSIYDNGKKSLSKQFKLLAIGVILLAMLIVRTFDFVMVCRFIVAYPLIWFGIYDTAYNLLRKPKLPWNYHGQTSGWYSTYRNKVGSLHFLYAVMALILGVSLFYMEGSIIS